MPAEVAETGEAYRLDAIGVIPCYSAADRGAEYCDERVCLCVFVCPRSYLRNYTPELRIFFVHVSYGRGSVLLWRRSDMLCVFPVL